MCMSEMKLQYTDSIKENRAGGYVQLQSFFKHIIWFVSHNNSHVDLLLEGGTSTCLNSVNYSFLAPKT